MPNANTTFNIQAILDGWEDETKMRHYKNAISEFRKRYDIALEAVRKHHSPSSIDDHLNGFECWPTPHETANRTSEGILLEVQRSINCEDTQKIRNIPHLWTPFGKVKLIGGGSHDTMRTLIDNLFEALRDLADLVIVDEDIGCHNGNEARMKSDRANPRFWFANSDHKSQLVLLKFKEGYSFSNIVNVEPSNLHVFPFICLRRIIDSSDTIFAHVTDNAKAF